MDVYSSDSKESLCSSSSHETSSQNNVGSDEDTISVGNSIYRDSENSMNESE